VVGVLVVAKQRSGTNFLRGLISSAGKIIDFGEVFQPSETEGRWKYDTWREEFEEKTPVTYVDSVDHSFRYLSYLEEGGVTPCLDVKYNSLLRTIGIWYSPADIPPILMAAIRKKYLIIHLQRKNLMEHAVSTLVAQRSGVYVATSEEQVSRVGKVTISADAALRVTQQYNREVFLINYWIRRARENYPMLRFRNIEYEALTSASQEELERIIGDILRTCEVPMTRHIQPKTQKIIKDWRESVENAKEIEAAYSDLMASETEQGAK